MSTGGLVALAVIVGIVVGGGCLVWGNGNDISAADAEDRTVDIALECIKPENAEKPPCPDLNRDWAVPTDQPDAWVADNPVESGAIAAVAFAVIGRLYLFMRRLETASAP